MKVKVKDWLKLSKEQKIKMLGWLIKMTTKNKEEEINAQAEQAEKEYEDYIDNKYNK